VILWTIHQNHWCAKMCLVFTNLFMMAKPSKHQFASSAYQQPLVLQSIRRVAIAQKPHLKLWRMWFSNALQMRFALILKRHKKQVKFSLPNDIKVNKKRFGLVWNQITSFLLPTPDHWCQWWKLNPFCWIQCCNLVIWMLPCHAEKGLSWQDH